MIVFQLSDQAGFDLVHWIADHKNWLQVAIFILCGFPALVSVLIGGTPHLLFIYAAACIVGEAAIVYCDVVTYKRFPVWSGVLAVAYSIVLAWMLGFYSGYYARVLDPRRFDIILEGQQERLSSVRVLYSSTTGIVFSDDRGAGVSFVNLAKVVMIRPVAE